MRWKTALHGMECRASGFLRLFCPVFLCLCGGDTRGFLFRKGGNPLWNCWNSASSGVNRATIRPLWTRWKPFRPGSAPRKWTASWAGLTTALRARGSGSCIKRRWSCSDLMRNTLKKTTAGTTALLLPITIWTKRARRSTTSKRHWRPAPATRTRRNTSTIAWTG